MRLVTAREMREIDRRAMEEYAIPGVVLMENAGRSVADAVERLLGGLGGKRVVVLCGKGNNGGDGFVAARHLLQRGATPKVFLSCAPEEITGDAAVNFTIWQRLGQEYFQLATSGSLQLLKIALLQADAVVDALYGTGFRGKATGQVGRAIEAVNAAGKPVVAVDLPSGLEADTGRVNGPCIRATVTVTFGLPKIGLVLDPGVEYRGKLVVADISLPRVLTDEAAPDRYLLTSELVSSWFAPRPATAHKGDFGHVLVVGGSRGMIGAACLTAQAALRTGAGLVTLAVPRSLQDVAAGKLTEVMTAGLPETPEGALSREALPVVAALLKKKAVLALGPGLGQHPETVALVQELVRAAVCPLVVDADGLNAFAGEGGLPAERAAPLVVTPHPGEMGRLAGKRVAEVETDRVGCAAAAAREWQAVVVLKGARTVVASPDGYLGINTTGNPGMATGGSGDVLTGVVAALIAQGLDPFRAAAAAVHLHGRAGDLAAGETGEMGLTAGDICRFLPAACREIERRREVVNGVSGLG
ncbi:NAD(P)H-hydrate epimerase [Thermodesulfitimonas autotrophica]|uniref:Bifunctional NAD(P)H-hydrate repair enzyme n=1 Tax=Thermodesulfitimonas autotrophica TaxID=1894989 RepID=A0A3N5BF68_9THEO|nr:NAD(P)H-hydrate dehydratase [Thermodesulfitimonas autotrophica]RPF42681.1 NAD(P)H-hydrate epimerase [Thermodesulfitimonas autotrophica]